MVKEVEFRRKFKHVDGMVGEERVETQQKSWGEDKRTYKEVLSSSLGNGIEGIRKEQGKFFKNNGENKMEEDKEKMKIVNAKVDKGMLERLKKALSKSLLFL